MRAKDSTNLLPLTSLRFFLSSWIVWFHLYVGLRPADTAIAMGWPLHNMVLSAYVAVGFFFLLSGFLLAMNYPSSGLEGDGRLRFYIARLARIYPVYLLGLVLVAPAVLGPALLDHSLLLRRMASGGLNVLALQAWVPQAALSWNGPGWSVSCEIFFYACFPFLARYFVRSASVRGALRLLVTLWAVQLAVPALCVLTHAGGYGMLAGTALPETSLANLVDFNPLLSLPLFLTGIVTYRLFCLVEADGRMVGRGYLLYGPALAALIFATSMASRIPYPLLHNGLLLPAAVALILGLALGDRSLCALLSRRTLVFLGKASFAEYLLHFPVRWTAEQIGVIWTPLHQLEYFGVVLALSAMLFQYFEDPLQRRIRRALDPAKRARVPEEVTALSSVELA